MTIDEVLDRYRADREPVVVSTQRLHTTLRPLRRHLGGREAADVGRTMILEYRELREAEGVKPQTARRELVSLRAALRLAWKDGLLDRVPPIPMPAAGRPRQRVLSDAEIKKLRRAAAVDAGLAVMVDLMLATGARLEAVCELTWDRVDLEARVIDYRAPHPRAERRKHRAIVPITPALAKALRKRQGQTDGDLVVGRSKGAMYSRFRKAVRAVGLDGVSPHTLRHTVATELLRRVPLAVASRFIGHRSTAITDQVYGHLSTEDLEPAARAVGRWLNGRSSGGSRGRKATSGRNRETEA